MTDDLLLGAVEAGGTKIVCAVGRSSGEVIFTQQIPTRGPVETTAEVVDFFTRAQQHYGHCAAFGVASFGPAEVRPNYAARGRIGNTPKPGWKGINWVSLFEDAFDRPVGFNTDVNAAGLAEAKWGAGQGLSNLAYLTVGTGIGGALIIDGRPLSARWHPEMGHIPLKLHPRDSFSGICPNHGDCLEGMASGAAIHARLGWKLSETDAAHPLRAIISYYLAQLCAHLVYIAAPERIIIGGGVMAGGEMQGSVARQMRNLLRGYIDDVAIGKDDYIVAPALGNLAGIGGALLLAERALADGGS